MAFLKRNKLEIFMIAPLVLYILGFTLYPVLESIRLSFINADNGAYTLDNYSYIFSQRSFKEAFSNTILITLFGLILQLLLAVIIAILLKKSFKGKSIFRTIVLLPMGVPTIVSGVVMLYIFSTSGYLNYVLRKLGIIGIS